MATPQMGDIDSFVGLLSTVQFKSELDWASYILIMIMAGLGTFIGSYLKKKGERFATKKDFDSILRELEANTKTVEDIRSKFSEKNWINQQVWLKKQEAYASIFTLLLNIKKYVSHQASAYDEWTDINHYHPYFSFSYTPQDEARLKREWEIDKKTYEKKVQSLEYEEEAQKLKLSYEKSISRIFDLIDLQSIYLNSKVELEIKELKKQLATTDEEEDWDFHFERITNATNSAINNIRELSKEELKIGI